MSKRAIIIDPHTGDSMEKLMPLRDIEKPYGNTTGIAGTKQTIMLVIIALILPCIYLLIPLVRYIPLVLLIVLEVLIVGKSALVLLFKEKQRYLEYKRVKNGIYETSDNLFDVPTILEQTGITKYGSSAFAIIRGDIKLFTDYDSLVAGMNKFLIDANIENFDFKLVPIDNEIDNSLVDLSIWDDATKNDRGAYYRNLNNTKPSCYQLYICIDCLLADADGINEFSRKVKNILRLPSKDYVFSNLVQLTEPEEILDLISRDLGLKVNLEYLYTKANNQKRNNEIVYKGRKVVKQ